MRIRKQAMPRVWGKMGSGIMFRHNGERYFLQARAGVEQSGTWGIPGGALSGTEGYYDSKSLPKPALNLPTLKKLWDSALKETFEEVGNLPEINPDEEFKKIIAEKKYHVGGVDNFVYVTFIVDLNDEQVKNWRPLEESKEAEAHEWFSKGDLPENLHPGVSNFFDSQVDVTMASIAIKDIKTSESKWTQGQVFIDGDKIYDVEKLNEIVENNKVERPKLAEFSKQLHDKEVWAEGERKISPIMVLVNPTYDHIFIRHMSRIRTSDLESPILIRACDSKVIDGYHRLAKAFLLGRERINAYYVQEEQMNNALVKE